ncbi:MAG: sugar porter family MFS transporter [Gammaproteobacteria bacterium]|nr:sugar porter family MFS transporter [Gammaproteobacteria bacterium]
MKKKFYYVFVVAFIAALSGILFGFDTGVISGAILFISKEFHLSAASNGFVVSSVLMGACAGALISGRMTDHIGRKIMLIFDALLFIIGTLITVLAPSITLLVIGRVIVGIAIGIASFTAPLYISEISPKQYRGALVSLNQLAIAAGIFISYLVDYHFSHQAQWRWMFAVGIIPALFLFVGMCFLPFSPRWMASKGKKEKALLILIKLRRCAATAEKELDEIHRSLQHENTSWKYLFRPKIRRTLLIGIILAVIQQITGINTILYYAPTIFQMSGFTGASSAIFASIGIGIVFLVFTVVSVLLIDRVGRKPLLYFGIGFMAAALLAMMWAFTLNSALLTTKIVLMTGMLVYVMGFAVSLGPIVWLMISEIFPTQVRGFGASIATLFNWGSNGLVAITFLSLINHLGKSGTFFIYFIACLLSIIFVALFVPETKNCSLEKIEENLFAGKKLRHLGAHIS